MAKEIIIVSQFRERQERERIAEEQARKEKEKEKKEEEKKIEEEEERREKEEKEKEKWREIELSSDGGLTCLKDDCINKGKKFLPHTGYSGVGMLECRGCGKMFDRDEIKARLNKLGLGKTEEEILPQANWQDEIVIFLYLLFYAVRKIMRQFFRNLFQPL